MKGKKVVFTLMAVALLVLPTAMSASAAAPGDPDTTITVTGATLECGSTATSQILVTIVNLSDDAQEVRGVEVHLTFDPTLLQVVDADGDSGNGVQLAVESGLFDGDLRIGQNLADNGAGTIVFAVAQSGGTPVFNAMIIHHLLSRDTRPNLVRHRHSSPALQCRANNRRVSGSHFH